MIKTKLSFLVLFIALTNLCVSQNIPILDYSVNPFGQVLLQIEGEADKYYVLTVRHEPGYNYESVTSITMGVDGLMFISEPLAAFDLQSYQVTGYPINDPADTDGDGIDDITEFNSMPSNAPLNFAQEIPFIDGTTSIPTADVFTQLAVVDPNIPWAPFLNNQEFAKFVILNQETDSPRIYFINSNTHYIHADFLETVDTDNTTLSSGEVIFNPNDIQPNGTIGSYSFNYSFGDSYSFEYTQRTYELLAANMPFLKNNFKHFIGDVGENSYQSLFKDGYEGSRIPVTLESDVFADVDFLPFNQAEGYGFFRVMTLDENPGSRDVVLYDALPNSLPRVGGIITSVIQTPLSHVNLRAIQDNLPNAYIKEPLEIDSISSLLGKYIYYRVEQDRYVIREASLEEVNEWYDKIRPTEDQTPERDLSQTEILPLDEIEFGMSNAFGAKCTNVATMRDFGFPTGTIPDGFGVPFYFYDEFMKFNGFYDQAESMINDPDFISDLETRIEMLKDFRKEIRAADMPQWMLDELDDMHKSFPAGTAVRCRSSTNNEDLPGFSGAGLYTSKTQHLDEGHISKSIKQVYASIWNFRAYDERDFYRVDHFIAAMGVLCHPNFQEEKSNGVGVSLDPIYETANTFYLNTQVGEFLITNPDANSIPEEILLSEDPSGGYFVLRNSNLVPNGELVMNEAYLDLMREYLTVIHDEFEILYNVEGAEGFGMDIEYKVTAEDQLIIKQARPWVSFWSEIKSSFDLAVTEISQPQSSSSLGDAEIVTAKIDNRGLRDMKDFEISLLIDEQAVETIFIDQQLSPQSSGEYQFTLPQDLSVIGDYSIGAAVSHPSDGYDKNDTLITVVSKLHLLEGELTAELLAVDCDGTLKIAAHVTNYGEATFSETKIEVVVNGVAVDTLSYLFSIPYLTEVTIEVLVNENLQQSDNEITLNLIEVNGSADAIASNNTATINAENLESNFDFIELVINPDDYPEEISWALYDVVNNAFVDSGNLFAGQGLYTQTICVDYSSCLNLYLYDSFGDGFCCDYGDGDFLVLNSAGDTILIDDGDIEFGDVFLFCPDGDGCVLEADIIASKASGPTAADGTIEIIASNGMEPYEFSIDGGQSFANNNFFTGLPAGNYLVIVRDATGDCVYEESIDLEFDIVDSVSEISENKVKLYPNPTSSTFMISLDPIYLDANETTVNIYNSLGSLIQTVSFSSANTDGRMEISLESEVAGTYIAKCFNQNFEHYFRVIKI